VAKEPAAGSGRRVQEGYCTLQVNRTGKRLTFDPTLIMEAVVYVGAGASCC